MDPQPPFCPNLDCPARGQVGEGNITSHGRKRPRSHCKVCGQTFSARRDTPFYRRRSSETLMTQVLTLVAHGCPIAAIEAAFGLQARTVRKWIAAAGQHAQAIQEQLVEQPRDLQQVQAARSALRCSAESCGWPWRSWSARVCGWAAPSASNATCR